MLLVEKCISEEDVAIDIYASNEACISVVVCICSLVIPLRKWQEDAGNNGRNTSRSDSGKLRSLWRALISRKSMAWWEPIRAVVDGNFRATSHTPAWLCGS